MTDRELLEAAAKVIGLDLCFNDAETPGYYSEWRGLPQWGVWNPLVHDGHALRLAVKLGMSVDISEDEASTYAYAGDVPRVYAMEIWRDDRDAATRRAIVRAAAAMADKGETA